MREKVDTELSGNILDNLEGFGEGVVRYPGVVGRAGSAP
jgi:hypothetical protein